VLCFWSAKGGAGCSVTAAAVALLAAERGQTLLVDLVGEQSAVLGIPSVAGPGLSEWLHRPGPPPPDALARLERPVADGLALLAVAGDGDGGVPAGRLELLGHLLATDRRCVVVDVGRWDDRWTPVAGRATARVLVTRLCYLALRAASERPTPTGVVVLAEPGRALTPGDVASVLDAPVLVRVPIDPAVARVVDAGLLTGRIPRPLRRLGALVPGGVTP
jgi:hypothetical protein